MGRYERDYFGREPGRRDFRGPRQSGAYRPGDWGGPGEWRSFGEMEERFGEGYESLANEFYDRDFERGPRGQGGSGGYPWGQSGAGFEGGAGRGRGAFEGYGGRYGGGREGGYMEGWQDQRGGMSRGPAPRQGNAERSRPRASEIMTENPHVVTPDATISEVAQKMRDLDVGIIPVVESVENRRLRGVITDRDITLRAVAEGKGGDAKVSECMTDRVRAVNKNDSIQDVMWVMRREQVRRVPVTDREGRLVGIIAQADLAVDYASDDEARETEVGETLERISEPARPGGQRGRMSASGRNEYDDGDDGHEKGRGRSKGRSDQTD